MRLYLRTMLPQPLQSSSPHLAYRPALDKLNNPRMGEVVEVFGLFHVDLDKACTLAPVRTLGAPHGREADFLSRRHYLLYINIPVLRISA